MTKFTHYLCLFFVVFACLAMASENKNESDWQLLWKKRVMKPMPKAQTIQVGKVGSLGQDLEDRQWQMIPTVYHEICFQPSADPNKITELYFLIDNLYEFLEGRSLAGFKPQTPIRAFIVPGQWGRSRCCWDANAMRTGDQGDLIFNMTSLLHEETHLFNMAFLVDKPQGWWAGEFFCQYFQNRAQLMAQKKNIKKEIQRTLPEGPGGQLKQLDSLGKEAFDEAFSALYFFEEKYDPNTLERFRSGCLEDSKTSSGGNIAGAIFEKAFGKDIGTLEKEWRAFYGWTLVPSTFVSQRPSDERPKKLVSYSTDQASIQTIIQALAEQAGIQYNRDKSFEQTNPECRNFVRDVRIENKPLHQAMMSILKPQGLTYTIENGAIVLNRK